MFLTQAMCPVRAAYDGRVALFSIEPGLIGRRLLAAAAGVAFIAAIASLPQDGAVAPAPSAAVPAAITLHAATTSALAAQAEAMRADLLAKPGVRTVTFDGLRQQGLSVEYSPRRLSALGISTADLQAALPVDMTHSRPGHLALRADADIDGLQQLANLPIRAGHRVFRLGDVAAPLRAPLNPPVSTLTVEGEPAVRLVVTASR
jgi:multidrug efflux pump subunit AcrB